MPASHQPSEEGRAQAATAQTDAAINLPPEDPARTRSLAPVLVIEDDRDSRDMLCTWLRQHGYDTISASDGRDALNKMEHAPDLSLILLDLMMPVMTGWQFRTTQRTHRRFRKVPVVVMTAHPNPAGEAEWLDPEDVLLKPLDLQAVLRIVSRCCGPHDGSLGLHGSSGRRPN